ncbi:MAG: PAS domain S-box protein [Calditrichaceae bacterium]
MSGFGSKIFGSMKIVSKFRWVAAGFSLPVIILLYLLISEKNIAIDFARQELKGIQYLNSLSRFSQNVTSYQSVLKIEPEDSPQKINSIATRISNDFTTLRLLESDPASSLYLGALTDSLSNSWNNFYGSLPDTDQKSRSVRNKKLLRHWKNAISTTGNKSNLILDPDLDSFYLIHVVVKLIPEQIIRIQDILFFRISKNTSTGDPSFGQAEMLVFSGLINANINEMRDALEISYLHNPDGNVEDSLKSVFETDYQAVSSLLADVRQSVKSAVSFEITDIEKSSLFAIESAYSLWAAGLSQLEILLHKRIQTLNRRKNIALGGIASILLLTGMLFFFVSKNIVLSVESLDQAAIKIIKGDLDVSVEIPAGDELGNFGENFNRMIRALSGLLSKTHNDLSRTQKMLASVIEDHRETESALIKSELLFDNLWDISEDGMRLTDNHGKILAVNDAMCRIAGLEKKYLENNVFTVMYHEDERINDLADYRDAIEENSLSPHFEALRTLWDGRKIWFEFSNSLLHLPDSTVLVLSIIKDISERKKSEFELTESEKKFRMIFNNANDAVFVSQLTPDDQPGEFIEVNDIACRRLGYSKEELINLPQQTIFPPSQINEFDRIVNRLKKERHVIFESLHLTKDRRQISVEISSHLFEFNGTPTVLSIARDITERKRAEENLKKSGEQLRNLASHLQTIREEERIMIAREIHDELGQVLTVLKIQLSLLLNKLDGDKFEFKDKFDSISNLIDQAVESVQRISTKLRPGILDELGLIPAIEWQAQEFQEKTGIICKCSLPPENILIDKTKSTAIFRIFQEALTNVARHANAKKISVIFKQENGHLQLDITDNGDGISQSQINDARSLGLLGMKERAVLLGGTVQINGVSGKGTNVKVIMPIMDGLKT